MAMLERFDSDMLAKTDDYRGFPIEPDDEFVQHAMRLMGALGWNSQSLMPTRNIQCWHGHSD